MRLALHLLKPIWQVGPILPSAVVDIVCSVEQGRDQEVFIEFDDFDIVLRRRMILISLRSDGQATYLCDKKLNYSG